MSKEKKQRKWCPMARGEKDCICVEDGCAWWISIEGKKCCAIADIAHNLNSLSFGVETIMGLL